MGAADLTKRGLGVRSRNARNAEDNVIPRKHDEFELMYAKSQREHAESLQGIQKSCSVPIPSGISGDSFETLDS